MKHALILAVCFLLQEKSAAPRLPAMEEAFRFSQKEVVGLDFAPSGGTLAIGGEGYVALLDLKTQKFVRDAVQEDLVDEVQYDPKGTMLITRSAGPDTVVRKPEDLSAEKVVVDMPLAAVEALGDDCGPKQASCPAAFTPDGKRLALVNGGRGFRVWSTKGLAGDAKKVYAMGFEMIPLRKPRTQDERNREADATWITLIPGLVLAHATALRFEGDRLWIGMEGGYLLPVDTELFHALADPGRSSSMLPTPGLPPPPTTTPDPYKVRRPRQVTLKQGRIFQPHESDPTAILPLPGGRTLLTAGWDGKVKVWETRGILERIDPADDHTPVVEPQPLKVLDGYYACLSRSGKLLAVAESEGVRVYDSSTFATVSWTPTDPKLGRPTRVKFSPDDGLLALTLCNCGTCRKTDTIETMAKKKKRSHHHGGTLVVWKVPAGK